MADRPPPEAWHPWFVVVIMLGIFFCLVRDIR
jgi:hypothetical protein